jgi:hypothetical protein
MKISSPLFSINISALLLISLSSFAQNINTGTNIFISSGLEVYIGGSVMNTGFFQNNGRIKLAGNWINTSVYQGSGIVSLDGVDQLLINNNQAINYLIINGGGVKTLQGLLTITGKIDFNDGIVNVGNSDTLLMTLGSSVTGGSDFSYVNGALTAEGSGYKFFPIGKNGAYHPVELVNVKGITPTIEMEVIENLPEIQTAFPTRVKQAFYWTRKTISGSFNDSPVTLGYNLQSITNLARLVVLEGDQIDDVFTVKNNITFNTSLHPNITSTDGTLTKNIFALGELLIDPPGEFYLSTTLSPNAANPANRNIKVFGDNLSPVNFSFQVFNRWGLLIFETDSFEKMNTQGWDGTQGGNFISSGIYPYSLKYVDVSGIAAQRTGYITIIH